MLQRWPCGHASRRTTPNQVGRSATGEVSKPWVPARGAHARLGLLVGQSGYWAQAVPAAGAVRTAVAPTTGILNGCFVR